MSIESLYNSVFHLYSNEITGYDSIGGSIRNAVFQNSYACYFTMLSGNKQIVFGKNNIVSTHLLFTKIIDISTTDLVRINDLWYEVTYVDNCNNMNHHLEIYMYRADAPQILDDSSSSSSSSSYVNGWSSSSDSSESSSSSSS
jgi:hypothetical protein